MLVADVPCIEAGPYVAAAQRHGVDPALIATANSGGDEHLRRVAATGKGYTYVVSRTGVTGVDEKAQTDQHGLIEKLELAGSPPSLLGFGIAKPEHVRNAIQFSPASRNDFGLNPIRVYRLVEKAKAVIPGDARFCPFRS